MVGLNQDVRRPETHTSREGSDRPKSSGVPLRPKVSNESFTKSFLIAFLGREGLSPTPQHPNQCDGRRRAAITCVTVAAEPEFEISVFIVPRGAPPHPTARGSRGQPHVRRVWGPPARKPRDIVRQNFEGICAAAHLCPLLSHSLKSKNDCPALGSVPPPPGQG